MMLQNDKILLEYAQGLVEEEVRAAEMERLGRRLRPRRPLGRRMVAWAGAASVVAAAVAGLVIGLWR